MKKSVFQILKLGLLLIISVSLFLGIFSFSDIQVKAETTYIIHFDANGGEGVMEDQVMSGGGFSLINDNQYTNDGYFLKGWINAYDRNQRLWFNGHNINPDNMALVPDTENEILLIAQWQPVVDFTIHFDPGEGEGTMEDQIMTGGSRSRVIRNTFTRDGYMFKGWTCDDITDTRFTGLTNEGIFKSDWWNPECNDLTFTAQWEEGKEYTIHFDPNGGEGVMEDQIMKGGSYSRLKENAYTNPGYYLKGWINLYDPTNYLLVNTHNIDPYEQKRESEDSTDIWLVAQWEPAKSFTIHFDGNGGEGFMDDLQADAGSLVRIPRITYTKDGQMLSKWICEELGNGFSIGDNGLFNVARWNPHGEDLTFVAQWEKAKNYKIHFDANGGSGTMQDQEMQGGKDLPVSALGFINPGYMFTGWSCREIPGLTVGNENIFYSGEWNPDCDDLTFVAQWAEAKEYTIRFDANGGTGKMSDQTIPGGKFSLLNESAFQYSDNSGNEYFLKGWINKYDGEKKLFFNGHNIDPYQQPTVSAASTDIVFVAQWQLSKDFVIHFDPGTGSGTMADQTVKGGSRARINRCAFSKEGYMCTGWICKEITDYRFTGVTNEGVFKSDWWNPDCKDITFVAQWEKVKNYTIHFDANGGSGTMPDQVMPGGSYSLLNPNTYTYKDSNGKEYFLKGWINKYDSEKILLIDGHNVDPYVLARFPESSTDIYLIAQWQPVKKVTLKFEGNGASGVNIADQIIPQGSKTRISGVVGNMPGYTFEGWKIKGDPTETIYANKEEIDPWKIIETSTSFELVAQWKPVSYLVRFEDKEAGKSSEKWVEYGDSIDLKNSGISGTDIKAWIDQNGNTYSLNSSVKATGANVSIKNSKSINILNPGEEKDAFWQGTANRGVQCATTYEKDGKTYMMSAVVRTDGKTEDEWQHQAYLVISEFDTDSPKVIKKKRVDSVAHANDIAYNPNNGHFYIAGGIKDAGIIEVDENLNVVNQKIQPAGEHAVRSIAYYDHKYYVVYTGYESVRYVYHQVHVLDENFNIIQEGNYNERGWYVAQGIYADENNIYTVGYISPSEDGEFDRAKISIFDRESLAYKGQFGFSGEEELEDIIVKDGAMYLITPLGSRIVINEAEIPGLMLTAVKDSAKVIPVDKLTLNKTKLDIYENDLAELIAAISPENATNKTVIWNSSNTTVATVVGGKITAKKAGTAVITVLTADGNKKAECTVTVKSKKIPVSGIKLSKSSIDVGIKKTTQLSATISPSNASNKNVTWQSGNTKIATIDNNGKVTGISRGTTTITATSVDGKKVASCKVNVLFSDVMDNVKYYYAPVYWAANKGITNGYSDGKYAGMFGHELNCTRAHVVTFLWRLANKPEPKTKKNPFKDVKSNQYYYKAVLWAAEKGITKGYSDGTFRPDATCLREHVVTFLWRYAGKPAVSIAKSPFNDVKKSDYYYKASVWANKKGIAKGYNSGKYKGGFGPKLDCLREHVVTFLYRFAK